MNTREQKGDFETLASIIDRSIEDFIDDEVTVLNGPAFIKCKKLVNVDLPNATYISASAFNSCVALTSVNIPAATKIINSAFNNCTSLVHVDLPSATYMATNVFTDCSALVRINLPSITEIGDYSFLRCYKLKSVIIRTPSIVATLAGSSAFPNSTIIYVPDDLVDSYKEAPNWSIIADRIKGLSELPAEEGA